MGKLKLYEGEMSSPDTAFTVLAFDVVQALRKAQHMQPGVESPHIRLLPADVGVAAEVINHLRERGDRE